MKLVVLSFSWLTNTPSLLNAWLCAISFWTKRRKFQAKIEKFLQNVAERQESDYEAAGMASDSGHGSHLETEGPVPQPGKFLSEDGIQHGQNFEDERERLFDKHI